MSETFTWMPLYKEIAHLLLDREDRQQEILEMLRELADEGVKVTPLVDKDKSGNRFPLKEIDPFTFYGPFNRGIRDSERLAILKKLRLCLTRTVRCLQILMEFLFLIIRVPGS